MPLRTVVLVGEAAVAAVGVGLGVGFTVAASSAEDRVLEHQTRLDLLAPGDPTACANPSSELVHDCQGLATALSDRDSARAVALGGFVTGSLGALALLLTELLWAGDSGRAAMLLVPQIEGLNPAQTPQVAGFGLRLRGEL